MNQAASATSADEARAMTRALELAVGEDLPFGPNPRVGCVLLAGDGAVIAEGWHRGAGTPHAEADALAKAGARARGATAVVTLEPCNHTGRTPPCAQALIDAGVRRVVYAQSDPNPVAEGGAETLQTAGVEVVAGLAAAEATRLNRAWAFGLVHRRPLVTWKFAATIDGHTAAADGTSQWITSPAARADAHLLRAESDVILVGANTVATDDPHLTVRTPAGELLAHQPLRAVMGMREIPTTARIFDAAAPTVRLHTRDPHAALAQLYDMDRRHVFLEGGASLVAAFLQADLVDEAVGYYAPMLLGAGRPITADLGIPTLADSFHFELAEVGAVGTETDRNARLVLQRRR